MKVQCFATVSPSGDPGVNGLQGQLSCLNGELEFLSHLPRTTHKHVAKPDSGPPSQEECLPTLTQRLRDPSPGLSCYLGQPDGEGQRESGAAREHHGEESVPALESQDL